MYMYCKEIRLLRATRESSGTSAVHRRPRSASSQRGAAWRVQECVQPRSPSYQFIVHITSWHAVAARRRRFTRPVSDSPSACWKAWAHLGADSRLRHHADQLRPRAAGRPAGECRVWLLPHASRAHQELYHMRPHVPTTSKGSRLPSSSAATAAACRRRHAAGALPP